MKTTVDIPDDLLKEARAVATTERITLRALIEEGLRWALSRRRRSKEKFVLRDAAVSGNGTHEGVDEGDWNATRDRIYEGRGS